MTIKLELILTSFVYMTVLKSIRSQSVQSPCPEVFQYRYNEQTGLYGELEVVTEHTNYLRLNLQMSIGNSVKGYNGKLELANYKTAAANVANGQPLLYYLYFPVWHDIVPKITQILVNGNLICSGPKIQMNLVPIITTVNLQHTLRVNVQPLSTSNVPPESNFIPASPHMDTDKPPDNYYYQLDEYGRPKPPMRDMDRNKFNFHPTLPPNQQNFHPRPEPGYGPEPGRGPEPGSRPPPPPPPGQRPPQPPPEPGSRPPPPSGQRPPPPPPGPWPGPEPGTQPPHPNPADIFKGNPFFSNENIGTPRPSNPLRPTQNIPSIAEPTLSPASEAPDTDVDLADIDLALKDGSQPTRPFDEICGQSISTNHLIFDGRAVPRGAYPWLVAIFHVKTTGLNYICSGSLISSKHIVTAAHCVESDRKKLRPHELLLILGKLNIHKWIPVKGEKIVEPDSITIHPDYESLTSDADIAVLILDEPLQFTKYIRPICLWRGDTDLNIVAGQSGTIVGWGKDEHGVLMTEEPKQTDLPIVTQEKCLASNLQFHYITSNRTFCAGFRNGTGPCNGDSGGGFIMKWEGKWMLRGIVSLSISETHTRSCDLSNYVVFTDASKFIDWLLTFLK